MYVPGRHMYVPGRHMYVPGRHMYVPDVALEGAGEGEAFQGRHVLLDPASGEAGEVDLRALINIHGRNLGEGGMDERIGEHG